MKTTLLHDARIDGKLIEVHDSQMQMDFYLTSELFAQCMASNEFFVSPGDYGEYTCFEVICIATVLAMKRHPFETVWLFPVKFFKNKRHQKLRVYLVAILGGIEIQEKPLVMFLGQWQPNQTKFLR